MSDRYLPIKAGPAHGVPRRGNTGRQDLSARLQGRCVLVESEQGQRFEGYLTEIHLPTRHVLLQDVTAQPGGATYSQAFVAHADWIVPTEGETEIVELNPAAVSLPDYAVDAFAEDDHAEKIRQVSRAGVLDRFPVVTPTGDELVLVEGHYSHWLARQAHLLEIPVIVESLSEWRQAVRFAFAHYPLPDDQSESESSQIRRYSDSALEESIKRYVEEFGDRATEVYPVRVNVKRFGIT